MFVAYDACCVKCVLIPIITFQRLDVSASEFEEGEGFVDQYQDQDQVIFVDQGGAASARGFSPGLCLRSEERRVGKECRL